MAVETSRFIQSLVLQYYETFGFAVPDSDGVREVLEQEGFSANRVEIMMQALKEICRLTERRYYRHHIQIQQQEQEITEGVNEMSNEQEHHNEQGNGVEHSNGHHFAYISRNGKAPSTPHEDDHSTVSYEEAAKEVLRFKIAPDSVAEIMLSGPITQDSINKLISFLELSRDSYPLTLNGKNPNKKKQETPPSGLSPEEGTTDKRGKALWKNKDFDQVVTITGSLGFRNGQEYLAARETSTGLPMSELYFYPSTNN